MIWTHAANWTPEQLTEFEQVNRDPKASVHDRMAAAGLRAVAVVWRNLNLVSLYPKRHVQIGTLAEHMGVDPSELRITCDPVAVPSLRGTHRARVFADFEGRVAFVGNVYEAIEWLDTMGAPAVEAAP